MADDGCGGAFYDEQVTDRYLAHRHSGTSSPNVVMEEPAVLDQLGDLTGLRVLDLGCGDGSFSETVLSSGATTYLGIDGSAAMIEIARDRHTDRRSRFEVASMEQLEPAPGSADLVTSRMAFHYLADLRPVLRAVRVAVGGAGRLVFTVTHPVITSHDNRVAGRRTSWTVDHYFEPGARHRAWFGKQVTWYHRTIESYVSAVIAAGFGIDAISECEPSEVLLSDEPEELARRRRVPLMLLVAARCP
jgi:ubiquinone/menaquinone biosynthesis C-methylase UbiE